LHFGPVRKTAVDNTNGIFETASNKICWSWAMGELDIDFYKMLFEDLDPENLRKRFLRLLLRIQNVERGSVWIQQDQRYICVESLGGPTDKDIIKGASIPVEQPSIVGWVMKNAEMTVAKAGKDPRHYSEFEKGMRIKSALIFAFPLILKNGNVYGVVQLIDTSTDANRPDVDKKHLGLLKSIIDIGSTAFSNALTYTEQVEKNFELEQILAGIRSDEQIIGQSHPFIAAMKQVRDYAATDFPVLITGESGTGKDLIAAALHNLSSRRNEPFIVQNCSAIPNTLLESELFGHKKGAFTDAIEDKIGILKAADGGTVFLDEIGDMSLHLQARLLRVIQNSEIKPLGETKTSKINIRIISATNKDLTKAIAQKDFRRDLFYRINVLPLHLPPLRKRKRDIPLLLNYFMKRESLKLGVPARKISKKALEYLENHYWEGNIRELENFVKYILSAVDNHIVGINDIPDHFKNEPPKDTVAGESRSHKEPVLSSKSIDSMGDSPFSGYSWEKLERDYVLYLLNKNKWNITRAADDAKMNRSTFNSRMKKLGIQKN
jgi:transcriptional regulator with GAF, ATPase, and Fis domain